MLLYPQIHRAPLTSDNRATPEIYKSGAGSSGGGDVTKTLVLANSGNETARLNRYAVVSIVSSGNLSGVTLNGSAMTLLYRFTGNVVHEFWGKANPETGDLTFVLSFQGQGYASQFFACALEKAAQSNTLNASNGVSGTNSGTEVKTLQLATSSAHCLCIGSATHGGPGAYSISPNSPQIERLNQPLAFPSYTAAIATRQSILTSTPLAWTTNETFPGDTAFSLAGIALIGI